MTPAELPRAKSARAKLTGGLSAGCGMSVGVGTGVGVVTGRSVGAAVKDGVAVVSGCVTGVPMQSASSQTATTKAADPRALLMP